MRFLVGLCCEVHHRSGQMKTWTPDRWQVELEYSLVVYAKPICMQSRLAAAHLYGSPVRGWKRSLRGLGCEVQDGQGQREVWAGQLADVDLGPGLRLQDRPHGCHCPSQHGGQIQDIQLVQPPWVVLQCINQLSIGQAAVSAAVHQPTVSAAVQQPAVGAATSCHVLLLMTPRAWNLLCHTAC